MRNSITETELIDLMNDIEIEVPGFLLYGAGSPDADESDDDFYGDYLTIDYSGRGMYGDSCIGVVCADPARVMFDLGMAIGERAANETGTRWWDLSESFKRARTDSMGLSSIVYWEGLTLASQEVGS
jgi:hypothetical protein